jgi:curli biogenesis system outer membrane secretion channel CsgG
MKTISSVLIVAAMLFSQALAQSNTIDDELLELANKLSTLIKDQKKAKVTVLDFTDLQGASSELGKYIAEQLTVNLVIAKKGFAVLDRANLKSILAEHKLTASGLVDPENAKKLGQFAGVDALILGTITPRSQNMSLTAKIITTDTAEVVGAAKAEFKKDENVQQLISHFVAESKAGSLSEEKSKITKSFGDLRVEVQSLHIVNGTEFLLSFALSNQNPKQNIWVAWKSGLNARIFDSAGFEFEGDNRSLSGVESTEFYEWGFSPATELKPNGSVSASLKFFSRQYRKATPGVCRLQFDVFSERDLNNQRAVGATSHTLSGKIEAD